MPQQAKITIAIPTFRRPDGIQRALDSIEAVQIPAELSANVLVVDNDAQASAKPIVEDFAQQSRFEVFYVVEPQRGLSNVRNRILKEAIALNADYLAGIDDDETATPVWLTCLWNGLQQFDADCAGGLQQFLLPQNAPEWAKYVTVFKPYAKRHTGKRVSDISTGNYLLSLSFVRKHRLQFSPEFNFSGGEDSDFFTRCAENGAKVVWIKEAVVEETIAHDRLKIKWVAFRYFRIGHSVVSIRKKNEFKYFLKSLIKITYYLPVSALLFVIRKKGQAYKYFFRFFFHMGKLSAHCGMNPHNGYKDI